MLEVENFIKCGFMINPVFNPLYFNPVMQEVVFYSDTDGEYLAVGEVDIEEPLEMFSFDSFEKAVIEGESGGAIGFIFKKGGEVIAILDDDTAETRSLSAIYIPTGKTFSIDLNYVALTED
jgi:hypothetical protein